jgi:hypothetical protein
MEEIGYIDYESNEKLKFNPYWPKGDGFLSSYLLFK